ncbi:probable NAD(P)H dehydrogenase (quinone) FQR1-like 3 [Salvia hispanica]|uniref:probable NAD(P)H dehydrogenase (quinone) FQR1-like 3 n=1 Tax=Salvia hispanica TaxID=49212 RepID=UPI00200944AA|nr:probable NAD(P)H dehydrogenase (quinone) FQR1-like 3 [Salvia hispanica]
MMEVWSSIPATIERMEMLILRALKWRMHSVNPFSFLNYFVSLFDSGDDERSIQALKNRGAQIIFKSQNGSLINQSINQMKAFFDSTTQLWKEQKLAGKPAGFFVSTGTQGGGQETTALNDNVHFKVWSTRSSCDEEPCSKRSALCSVR